MSNQISRRGFFRLFGAAAAAAAAPTYFLPPIGGWKSATILNPNHYRYFVADDLVQSGPSEAARLYYNPQFLENLKSNMDFALMAQTLQLPTVRAKLAAEGLQVDDKQVVEMMLYGL